jgi:hypothetical protein
MELGDVGTVALIGGILGEAGARVSRFLGREPAIDGWREGMFVGGVFALLVWSSGEITG